MATNFDLIVFDWDGTLLDSAAAIVRSIPVGLGVWAYPSRRLMRHAR